MSAENMQMQEENEVIVLDDAPTNQNESNNSSDDSFDRKLNAIVTEGNV